MHDHKHYGFGYTTGALASAGVGYPITAYNFLPNETFLQKAVVRTDANGALGIINIVTVQFTTFPVNNSSAAQNTIATRLGSLYKRNGATMNCTGPEIQALRKGAYSGTFNPEYVGLEQNHRHHVVAVITGVFIQPSPDATVIISQPTPILIVGQASTILITINNIGGTSITTPLTTTIVLPVGITMPATFTNGAWICTTSGQTVTCTNPNTSGVPVGGNVTLNLIVTPQPILVGTTPTITINVLPFSGESNTSNNGGTLVIINPVGAPLVPDLTISLN